MTTFKLDLGDDCYVERSCGNTDIVIMKYDNGKPSHKNAILPLRRWKELEMTVVKIDNAVAEVKGGKDVSYKWHIGGNVYVTVCKNFPTVDIRHFWDPRRDGNVVATRKGVSLRYRQYEQLKACIELLTQSLPELEGITPCYMQNDHSNQMGFLRCAECNPNDCTKW